MLSLFIKILPATGLLIFCFILASQNAIARRVFKTNDDFAEGFAIFVDSSSQFLRPMQFESPYFELGGTIYIQESSGKIKYQTYWDKRLFQ